MTVDWDEFDRKLRSVESGIRRVQRDIKQQEESVPTVEERIRETMRMPQKITRVHEDEPTERTFEDDVRERMKMPKREPP